MSDRLNSVLDDISAEIGFTATSTLAAWFGGSNLYVPGKADPEHAVAKMIGFSAFRRLVECFGSETLWLPDDDRGPDRRDRLICSAFAEGKGAKTISGMTGLSERRVNQIRIALETRGLLPLILKNNPKKYP